MFLREILKIEEIIKSQIVQSFYIIYTKRVTMMR
ncbi:MAG: hypothetical protein PHE29_08965 [Tissierellia bacterium]|nr:hypothetical protein [Tissierellia bacterium]